MDANCLNCGCEFETDAGDSFPICPRCDASVDIDNDDEVVGAGETQCDICGENRPEEEVIEDHNGQFVCDECAE